MYYKYTTLQVYKLDLFPIELVGICICCYPGISLYLIPSNLVGNSLWCVPGIMQHIKPIELVCCYVSGLIIVNSSLLFRLHRLLLVYVGMLVCCSSVIIKECHNLKAEKPSAKTQAEAPNKRKEKRKQDAYIYFNSIADINRLKQCKNAQNKRLFFVQV